MPSNKLFMLLISIFTAMSINLSWAGDFYKWVDDNGVTHYSQRKPEKAADTISVKTKKTHNTDLEQIEATEEELEAEAKAKEEAMAADELAAAKKAEKARKKTNCSNARANLKSLQAKRMLKEKAANGSTIIMTDQERSRKTKIAKKTIKDNC